MSSPWKPRTGLLWFSANTHHPALMAFATSRGSSNPRLVTSWKCASIGARDLECKVLRMSGHLTWTRAPAMVFRPWPGAGMNLNLLRLPDGDRRLCSSCTWQYAWCSLLGRHIRFNVCTKKLLMYLRLMCSQACSELHVSKHSYITGSLERMQTFWGPLYVVNRLREQTYLRLACRSASSGIVAIDCNIPQGSRRVGSGIRCPYRLLLHNHKLW
jgi:hypothetical protein